MAGVLSWWMAVGIPFIALAFFAPNLILRPLCSLTPLGFLWLSLQAGSCFQFNPLPCGVVTGVLALGLAVLDLEIRRRTVMRPE